MTLLDFKNKYLGKQVEYHSFGSGAKNQCVDLVNQYLTEVLGLDHIIGTNAKDFKDIYNPEQLIWIVNTPEGVPQAGDIVVWNGRVGEGAGHVAIFLEGNATTFSSLDQNWSQKERVITENHTYSNVTGWLRPKGGDSMQEELDACRSRRDELWNWRSEINIALGLPHDAPHDTMIKSIAGVKGRVTEVQNALSIAEAEVANRTEQISRANALLTERGITITQLRERVISLEGLYDGEAKAKGQALLDLAECRTGQKKSFIVWLLSIFKQELGGK